MESKIYTVSELNRLARGALEKDFSGIAVEGEISDLLLHRSGHWYFTLKDADAQLRVAMFRGSNQRVAFKAENGLQVLLTGRASIYEPRGSYQFIAESMAPAGLGKLQLAFEQLKARLAEEGLFEPARKQPLPTMPKCIAIITSPQGAAIRDMQSTFARRMPGIELLILPVAVQGQGAAAQIAAAIEEANALAAADPAIVGEDSVPAPEAIIIGRGGGSLEDLWSFNEATLAYAIANSKLPVVSAVGHETDFTIADFVADARAATPTAAAELLSPDRRDLLRQLTIVATRLARAIGQRNNRLVAQLAGLTARLRHPGDRMLQQSQKLDLLDTRLRNAQGLRLLAAAARLDRAATALLQHSPAQLAGQRRAELAALQGRLDNAVRERLAERKHATEKLASNLHIVSPLATLQRGYAIVSGAGNEILRTRAQASPGDRVRAQLQDGRLLCVVEGISDELIAADSQNERGQ
ncbi:MAG: exodeoxyribonuclease VII large subunit [Pseudomonadales bacterium]